MSSKDEKFKIKIGDEEKDFVVKHPTARIEAEANMHASKVFSRLVKEKNNGNEGLLLRSELDGFLRSTGLYSDDDIKNMGEMGKEVERLEGILMKGGLKKSEGRDAAIQLRRNRYGLLNLMAKRIEYDKNTIEHHSENARINYIISKCVCDADGSPVFRSVDDYEFDETGLKDSLFELISRVGTLCSSYDPEYEAKLIENKFLKRFNYCNDKFDLTDTEGNLVNEKGEKIDNDGNLLDADGKPIIVVKEIGEFLED